MVVGEFSALSTGFSTISLELLKRLHASGKYELLEYASYCPWGDRRAAEMPWRVEPAQPHPKDEEGNRLYRSNRDNEFGRLRFEEVALGFRPDATISWRDNWMDEFIVSSPFRRHYRYCYMPTVDSTPQRNEWVAQFRQTDALFAYTDFGADVLRGYDGLNVLGTAAPGLDFDAFKVCPDKRSHKAKHGIDPGCLVVGMVARSQERKRFPELMRSVRRLMNESPELEKRLFLYLHTGWPDLAWDLAGLLKEHGLCSRTLFSYSCTSCGFYFPDFFKDGPSFCKRCGSLSAVNPSTRHGIKRADLNEVYNLFDVYVQLAVASGIEMPLTEAAACGVPVMATDYAGAGDAVCKLMGWPVRAADMLRHPVMDVDHAVTDCDELVEILGDILRKPDALRRRDGMRCRKEAERHYSWDACAAKWMDWIDSTPPAVPWDAPARIHTPAESYPSNLTDSEFVRWGMSHVAGAPEMADSFLTLKMTRDLVRGASRAMGGPVQRVGREQIHGKMMEMAEKKNLWEARRTGR